MGPPMVAQQYRDIVGLMALVKEPLRPARHYG